MFLVAGCYGDMTDYRGECYKVNSLEHHKANSLGCHEANSDELGGPFCHFIILVISHFAMLSFNRSGSYCPYMVGV